MKQVTLLLLCLFWFGLNSCTEEIIMETNSFDDQVNLSYRISPTEAIKIADSYLDLFFPQTRNSSTRSTPTLEVYGVNSMTRSGDTAELDTMLYILNYRKEGFVLVGADRRAENLIYGISDTGTFQLQDTIDFPEMKNLIGTIQNFIISNKEVTTRSGYLVSPIDNKVWQVQERIEKPVIAKWGQGSPFNQCCITSTGAQALAGCGPIAVSQIMYYHGHPSQHTNTRTGQAYNYNWNNMKLITDATSTYSYPQYTQQVARFIEQVGSECYANYGVNTTSTYLSNSMDAMERMGYDLISVNGYRGPSYDIALVREGLSSYGPVMATGQSDSGGHAWVLDGYIRMLDITPNVSSTGIVELVRCNWGWNSRADGYYIGGIFDTRNGGYVEGNGTLGSYNFYHTLQVVPKITPSMVGPTPSLPTNLVISENTWFDLSVNWDIPNKSDYNFKWSVYDCFEHIILDDGIVKLSFPEPGDYSIGLRITGKYNNYDSGFLHGEVKIKENILDDLAKVKVVVWNDGYYDLILEVGSSTLKNVVIPPSESRVFSVYMPHSMVNDVALIYYWRNGVSNYPKSRYFSRMIVKEGGVIRMDIDNSGFKLIEYTCDGPIGGLNDYYWEYGMPDD